jgi:hypothetical protein
VGNSGSQLGAVRLANLNKLSHIGKRQRHAQRVSRRVGMPQEAIQQIGGTVVDCKPGKQRRAIGGIGEPFGGSKSLRWSSSLSGGTGMTGGTPRRKGCEVIRTLA